MQIFEFLFLSLFAGAIVWLLSGSPDRRRIHGFLVVGGIGLIGLGALIEGWRWQMLPAQLGFVMLVLALIAGIGRQRLPRAFGAAVFTSMLAASAFLAHELPIRALSEITAPVGDVTFRYSVADAPRIERLSSDRRQEFHTEVWHPADHTILEEYPVESLYHELYEGDLTIWSFLIGYFRYVLTHSHAEAPLVPPEADTIPVLLFEYGPNRPASRDLLLVEHQIRAVEYRVEDIAFVADAITDVRAPFGQPCDAPDTDYRSGDQLSGAETIIAAHPQIPATGIQPQGV